MKHLPAIIASLLLISCGDSGPRINGESAATFSESVDTILTTLGENDRYAFQKGIDSIARIHGDSGKARRELDGLSAEELLAVSDGL